MSSDSCSDPETCAEDAPFPVLTAVAAVLLTTAVILYLRYGSKPEPEPALDPAEYRALPLVKKERLSHDTRRFTFALPNGPNGILGLPVGQHITLKLRETLEDGTTKICARTYTPVSGDATPGTVEFVIKVYKAGVHPDFPKGGKMSQHLDSLKIGDTMLMKGPTGHMTYHRNGRFTVHPVLKRGSTPDERRKVRHSDLGQRRKARHFGMIAGGTGITPMLQIMHAVLRDEPGSAVTVSLLYANKTEDDILCREELEGAVAKFGGRFRLHHTLQRPPEGWRYSKGTVTRDMIREHLPRAAGDGSVQILMCGPQSMRLSCLENLGKLGYKKTDYFVF